MSVRVPRSLGHQDATGVQLKVGDCVRVVGVPDLSGLHPDGQAESLPVFQHLVGTYRTIDEFDEHGLAWLRFRIRRGPHAGLHAVAIEPWLLRLRRTRTSHDLELRRQS